MSSVWEARSARVRLRALAPDDIELYCALYGDDDTMAHIGPPLDRAHAERCFARALRRGAAGRAGLVVAIIAAGDDAACGICGVPRRSRDAAEVGVMLRADARGRGLARAALELLIEQAFSLLSVDEVWVQYPPGHRRMARVADELGLVAKPERGVRVVRAIGRTAWNDRDHINQGGEGVQRHRVAGTDR